MPRPSARSAILDKAVQMASVRGLDGLSIGMLAAATGKSKGGICAHFPAKTDLQQAVVERAAVMFREAVVEPAFREPAGLERLEALIDAWFAYIEAEVFQGGCFFTNAALELDDLDQPKILAEIRRLYRSYLELVERCVTDAISHGQLTGTADASQLALLLQGLELGALLRHSLGESDAYPRAHAAARALLEQHKD